MAAGRRHEVTGRELALLVAGACLLSVVMHWPLVLHLGDTIPKDLGDPLPQSWQVAWGGHALLHQPFDFFQSNQFWPLDDTLAFGDSLIGYAPAGLIGSGPDAAVVRYDLLFLFAYALAFAGTYLLARELGVGPGAAAVAGAAFAFAPFRLEQDGHLQVISSGGIPLALALGVRGLRLGRPAWILAAWLVATWQLSLGFALGLPLAYALVALGVVAAAVWWRRGRPAFDRRLLAAAIAGAAIFVVAGAALSLPYQRVADEHPSAVRSPATVATYSGPAYVFLVAPDENLVWGEATSGLRDELSNVPEKTLFPGLVVLGLAVAGAAWSGWRRSWRVGLVACVLVFSVLALGFREEGGLLWPYRVLYEALPGWDALRTPGRLVTLSSLALALLAAGGTEHLTAWLRRRWRPVAATAAVSLLAATIVVEGRGLPFDPTHSQAQPEVPDAPVELSSLAAPQLHLPAELADENRRYLLWSTDGFPDIVNGRASTEPEFTADLIAAMANFPDRATVARLRALGVASVVLHTERIGGTPQASAPARSVDGLGIERRRVGDVVVYEL